MSNNYLNLEKIYYETGGDEWTNRVKWLSDEPIHKWHGVTLEIDFENSIVISQLFLPNNNLTDQLHLSWNNLFTSMQIVDLSHNHLSGSIIGIFDGLIKLKELRLNDNQLNGTLPLFLSSTSLEILDLSHNQFSGSIPDEYRLLAALQELRLSHNKLSGKLSPSLKDLKTMIILCVDENEFEGEIPVEYGKLESLQELRLSTNKLSGIISEELKDLKQLKKLYLDYNQFTGPFPSWIVELVTLEELDIGQNLFTGNIPECICKLKNLTLLGLCEDQFTGNIPKSICQMTTLERIWLAGNQLQGEIPSNIGQLSQLTELGIAENQLTGEIPSSLGQLSRLTQLYLHQNQLRGEIPPSLGQLSQLAELSLYQNQLTGEIPPSLGQLSQLAELSLYQNQLTGDIPFSIGQLSLLRLLYLDKNQLSGRLPLSLSQLQKLTELTLDFNQISGSLLDLKWSDMMNLKNLRLHNNKFTGIIPDSLINHPTLETLELSGNEFNRNFDADISSLSWAEQKYWYTDYDVNEAMLKACKKGYMRVVKYLIDSKNYSNFLQKDKDGKHALDYLLLSNPYGALELFITADTHESDHIMYQKRTKGRYYNDAGESYLENQFQYNLKDGEYCIRGTKSKVIDQFWFKKVGELTDVRKLMWQYFLKVLFLFVSPSKPKKTFLAKSTGNGDKKMSKHDDDIDVYLSLRAIRSSASYPVTSYTLPFEYMSSVEFLYILVTLFDKTGDVRLYENENVKVAILAAWEGYGRWYHTCFLLLYMAFLITLSYSNYAYQYGHDLVVTIVLLTLNALLLMYEIAQISNFGMRKYLADYENVIEVTGSVLVGVGCILRLVYEEETDDSKAVMAIASVLLWTNALNYLRPFSLTGSLVRLVFTTIKAIIPFLLILALVLYGFSQAFYLLTYDNADYYEFSSPDRAYLHSFVYMMGQSAYHLGHNSNSNIMIALTVLFITFAQILLLNLLIAFLNNIYMDIQSKPEAQMLSERCRIITSQIRYWHFDVPRYIHYIKKNSDVVKDDKLKNDRLNTNTELKSNMEEKLKKMASTLATIEEKTVLINQLHTILTQNQAMIEQNKQDIQLIKDHVACDVFTANTTTDNDDNPLPYVNTTSDQVDEKVTTNDTLTLHLKMSESNSRMSLIEEKLKTMVDKDSVKLLKDDVESLHSKMDMILQAVSEIKSSSTTPRVNNDSRWITNKKE